MCRPMGQSAPAGLWPIYALLQGRFLNMGVGFPSISLLLLDLAMHGC
jgi:hypothetical protein